MRKIYERLVWWWYRMTGRDCARWLQSLINRAPSGGTVFVPLGTYVIGKSGPVDLHGRVVRGAPPGNLLRVRASGREPDGR